MRATFLTLSAVVALLIAAPARAIVVTEALDELHTCVGVDISSQTPTAVFAITLSTVGGTGLYVSTSAYRFAWVQNVDTTAAVFCRPGSQLAPPTISTSVATGVTNRGARISAGGDTYFSLVPGRGWYCLGNVTTASVATTVCYGK